MKKTLSFAVITAFLSFSPASFAEKQLPESKSATSKPIAAKKAIATSKPTTAKKVKAKKSSKLEPKALLDIAEAQLKSTWTYLQKKKAPRVYDIRYIFNRTKKVALIARDGIIVRASDNRKNAGYQMKVRFRVGNHKLDSTGRDGRDWKIYRHLLRTSSYIPSSADADYVRKRIWQQSDRQYKESMAQYHRKRYVRSLKAKIKDKSGDFSKEPATNYIKKVGPLQFDSKKWKKVLKKISAYFLKNKRIIQLAVSVNASQYVYIMLGSDGSRLLKSKTLYQYTIYLTYLTPQKDFLRNTLVGYVDTEARLPNSKKLDQLVQRTYQELVAQGTAPRGEPVEAPAILMPDVSGVLFHEALGHRLEGQRMVQESDGQTFLRKIGKKSFQTFCLFMTIQPSNTGKEAH